METLLKIQSELKAPKNQFNKFGGYNYRSQEDILEALKPLLKKHKCELVISDEIIMIGERYYVKATVTITDGEFSKSVSAFAREQEDIKGMQQSQITGATSSYARKYALNGLFLIDDCKDADHGVNYDVDKNNSTDIINSVKLINDCKTLDELQKVWSDHKTIQTSEAFLRAKENKKKELLKSEEKK